MGECNLHPPLNYWTRLGDESPAHPFDKQHTEQQSQRTYTLQKTHYPYANDDMWIPHFSSSETPCHAVSDRELHSPTHSKAARYSGRSAMAEETESACGRRLLSNSKALAEGSTGKMSGPNEHPRLDHRQQAMYSRIATSFAERLSEEYSDRIVTPRPLSRLIILFPSSPTGLALR